jgi:hypothetical protein
MELRNARLCLDCEEVHDQPRCPICGSETFSFISRWIPVATAQRPPRKTSSQEADVYKQLINGEPEPVRGRLLKRGMVGLTALGLMGLFFGSREARRGNGAGAEGGAEERGTTNEELRTERRTKN